MVLAASVIDIANGWPTVLASLSTAAPLQIQLIGVIAIGFVGLALLAAVVGLAIGAIPHGWPGSDACRIATRSSSASPLGLFGAAAGALGAVLRTPAWAQFPSVGSLGSVVPILAEAIDPVTGFFTRLAVMTSTLLTIDRITQSWTERRPTGVHRAGRGRVPVGRGAGERARRRLGAGGHADWPSRWC